jgi:hypothetical protein
VSLLLLVDGWLGARAVISPNKNVLAKAIVDESSRRMEEMQRLCSLVRRFLLVGISPVEASVLSASGSGPEASVSSPGALHATKGGEEKRARGENRAIAAWSD